MTQHSNLIGKAAVALVAYHLGRLGHEFAYTTDNSPLGDIWADIAGTKIGIEVKGTRTQSHEFHVAKSQTARC